MVGDLVLKSQLANDPLPGLSVFRNSDPTFWFPDNFLYFSPPMIALEHVADDDESVDGEDDDDADLHVGSSQLVRALDGIIVKF